MISRHPFQTLVNNMDKFHVGVANKKSELAREVAFSELYKHRKTLQTIQEEHSYTHTCRCMHEFTVGTCINSIYHWTLSVHKSSNFTSVINSKKSNSLPQTVHVLWRSSFVVILGAWRRILSITLPLLPVTSSGCRRIDAFLHSERLANYFVKLPRASLTIAFHILH